MSADPDTSPSIRFDEQGLVPAVVQDAASGAVIMLAYMNEEALRLTRETLRTHFWSRSRQALWRKGETSGHEQIVRDISVNCYEDSLLVRVSQVGPGCHTGHPTCFYRSLDEDGAVPPRVDLDPAATPAASAFIAWYGAYEYLRDTDLQDVSTTSRLLHGEEPVTGRIADELTELMGVLEGTHRHKTLDEDIGLEASQALYWLAVHAVGGVHGADILHLDDRVGSLTVKRSPAEVTVRLLALATSWREPADSISTEDDAARIDETAAAIVGAVDAAGFVLADVIDGDLDDLRAKPYLAPYFATLSRAAASPTVP